MLDSRWPHLCEVRDTPGLRADQRSSLDRAAAAIRSRTDFSVVYNRINGCLHFYLREPDIGAAVPTDLAYIGRGVFESKRVPDASKVDDICRYLQRGRASRWDKDRAAQYAANAEQSRERSRQEAEREESVRKTEKILRRTKNRLGMSSRFRPSAVVDGLKGTTP